MKEKTQNIIFLITEKLGVPKSVVWGLLVTMVLGTVTFSFAFVKTTSQTNKDFPSEQIKIIEAEKEQKAQRIDIEVIKTKVSNTDAKVSDLKTDMKNGFEEIKATLKEINRNTK